MEIARRTSSRICSMNHGLMCVRACRSSVEAPFRSAGLHTGIVTTSALATADLEKSTGITLLLKLSGKSLTASVFREGMLKLVRCVELSQVTENEILAVVFPTIAFVEDLSPDGAAQRVAPAFQGARLARKGLYRPTVNSLMNQFSEKERTFYRVNEEAITETIRWYCR